MTDDEKLPHAELADDAEADADRLEAHADEVSDHIDETRKEWEAKREDSSVPGANPPDPDESGA